MGNAGSYLREGAVEGAALPTGDGPWGAECNGQVPYRPAVRVPGSSGRRESWQRSGARTRRALPPPAPRPRSPRRPPAFPRVCIPRRTRENHRSTTRRRARGRTSGTKVASGGPCILSPPPRRRKPCPRPDPLCTRSVRSGQAVIRRLAHRHLCFPGPPPTTTLRTSAWVRVARTHGWWICWRTSSRCWRVSRRVSVPSSI